MKRFILTLMLILIQNLSAQNQFHETRIINTGKIVSYSLSSDGNWAVAGLSRNDFNSMNAAGEVHVYKRSGDSWQLYQVLHAPEPHVNGFFGEIVKISYTTLVVYELEALTNNGGKIHTYTFDQEGNWTVINTIEIPKVRSIDLWESRNSTGKYLGIGSDLGTGGKASAYYFISATNTWNLEASFTGGDDFGRDVAISPYYFIAADYSADANGINNAGAVFLFQYGTLGWAISDTIYSQQPFSNQYFGNSIDISEDYIAIGTQAIQSDSTDFAYLYNINEGNPILKKVLNSVDNPTTSHFGYSVALNGDRLLVGAPLQTHENAWNNNHGSAYLYKILSYNVFLEHEFFEPVTQQDGATAFGTEVMLCQDYLGISNSIGWKPENLYIYSGFSENYLLTLGSPVVIPELNDTVLVDVFIHLPEGESISSAELPIFIGMPTNVGYLAGFETEGTLVGENNWISEFNQISGLNIYQAAFAGASEITGYGKLVTLKIAIPNSTEDNIYSVRVDNSYGDLVFDDGFGYSLEKLSGILRVSHSLVGDVDLNGIVQAYDASYILKYLAGSISLNELQLFNADASANDTVSAFDASLVLMYKVGIIDVLPYTDPIPATGEIIMQDAPIAANQAL